MSVDLESLAQRLGAPEKEILATVETDAGVVAHLFDGSSYIDVPADKPDADGKTGLMYLKAPSAPTGFPVFAGDVPEVPHPLAAASVDEPETEPSEAGDAEAGEVQAAPAASTPAGDASTQEPATAASASASSPVPVKPTDSAPSGEPAEDDGA